MKILLIGEASYVHNTLKAGLRQLGHEVTHASDGNNWHNSPRDIDLRRDMRWGWLSGLWVLWQLWRHRRQFMGNDVVQVHNYFFLPLRPRWSYWLMRWLRRHNKIIVKGCWGDDPQVMRSQAMGLPRYNDTHVNGVAINVEENRERVAEQELKECQETWLKVTQCADALVPCLYEYFINYDVEPFRQRLHYIPLPIEIPENPDVKGRGDKIMVLVGVQPDRDYMKGANIMCQWVEQVARESNGRVVVKRVESVPYDEYCRLLDEADVLVDQLYSYTPSMNSLAAMARGTVVIGGGEEEYYDFIGEKELRPIINMRPGCDEENLQTLRRALLVPGRIEDLSRQSITFVRRHHDHIKVSRMYERLYSELS